MTTTTLILCIGNRDHGDDTIGPYIADHAPHLPDTIFLDAGTTPENTTATIKRHHPTRLILIDAATMDLPPGTIRRIPPTKIQTLCASTHGLSLSLLIDYLIPTIPDITLIGIQPKTLTGPLSPEAKAAADTVLRLLRQHKIEEIPYLH
jgi:hydrogenase 3 maturation protease